MQHSAVTSCPSSFYSSTPRSGYTLIEMMVTTLSVMILLAIGMPSMRHFIVETHLQIVVNQFVVGAMLARTEAIKRGRSVVICRGDRVQPETGLCITGAIDERPPKDWSGGWIVMVPNEPRVLLKQAALHPDISVIGKNKAIKYDAFGRPGASFTHLVFRYNGGFERVICFGRSGRINVLVGTSECV